MKSLLRAAAAAFVAAAPSLATAATADDFQVWGSLQASGSISGRLVGGLELSARSVDDSSRIGVLVVRPTIGYKLSDAITLHLGYAHQTSINKNRRDAQEDRIFLQMNWAMGKVGKGALTTRTRLEQRFLNTGNDTGYRARVQFKYAIPLKAKGSNFILSTEPIFALNTTNWGQRAGLEQWRNFVGVNFPLAKKLTLETGYQHRYQLRLNQPDRSDHIVPITLSYKF